MNAERFEEVFNDQMKHCADILLAKSKEYAIKNEDRLQHFKRTAGFLKTTPEDALIGMLSKHLISVVDMCRDPEVNNYTLDQWNEKLTDTINYLLLLKALVVERLNPVPTSLSEFVDQNLGSSEIEREKKDQLRKAMDQAIEEKINTLGPEEAWNPGRNNHKGLLPEQQRTIRKIKADAEDENNKIDKPSYKKPENPIVSEGIPDEEFVPDAECLRSLETFDNIGKEDTVVDPPTIVVLDATQMQPKKRNLKVTPTKVVTTETETEKTIEVISGPNEVNNG